MPLKPLLVKDPMRQWISIMTRGLLTSLLSEFSAFKLYVIGSLFGLLEKSLSFGKIGQRKRKNENVVVDKI